MNFWWGCNKVTLECKHCYIDAIMRRAGKVPFKGPMRAKDWTKPLKWDCDTAKAGERHRVFTCSMSDFFHEGADAWRAEGGRSLRRARISIGWFSPSARNWPRTDWGTGYPNVWLGVTCGCADSLYRLPHLRELPAAVKFVSAEPLLGRMDFRPHLLWLDWIISGCERAAEGERAVVDLDWVRDIDRQCGEAGKRHFFKQAYVNEAGVPDEEPRLDGSIVQEVPAGRVPLTVLV